MFKISSLLPKADKSLLHHILSHILVICVGITKGSQWIEKMIKYLPECPAVTFPDMFDDALFQMFLK